MNFKNLTLLWTFTIPFSVFPSEIIDHTFVSYGVALDNKSANENLVLNISWSDKKLMVTLFNFEDKCLNIGKKIGTSLLSVEGQAINFSKFCHNDGYILFSPSSEQGHKFVVDTFYKNQDQALKSNKAREELMIQTGEKYISPFDPRLKNIPVGGHLIKIGNLHYSADSFIEFLSNDSNKPL